MKTVLITDDEPHMRQLLKFCLARTGARLLLAGGGEEALAMARSQPVDLLVVDVSMPGMDGFATVRALRTMDGCADLPVIMLTARGLADVKAQADEIGVAAFFNKPFSPAELTAEATRLLAAPRG